LATNPEYAALSDRLEAAHAAAEAALVETRSRAPSAFIALLNVFFVSLAGTVPPTNVGVVATILAVVGIVDTLGIGLSLLEEWSTIQAGSSSAVLMVGSLIIYGLDPCSSPLFTGVRGR
jgi:hypothetical protein